VINVPEDRVLYLFSSSQRPLYKQDNINVLCYPPGSIIHFRYEKKWVGTQIVERNPDSFKNNEAIVVIVDTEEKGEENFPLFFPVRKAKIRNVDFEGSVIHFYFELLPDWIDYRKNQGLEDYQECMYSLRERPTAGRKRLEGKFISFEKLQLNLRFSTEAKAWESIIEKIGNLESYKETLFYRLDRIYEVKSKENAQISNFGDFTSGYTLRSGKGYNLGLSLKYGREPPNVAVRDRLVIRVDENFYTPIPDEITLGFRVDKQNIYLSTRQLLSESYTQLIITFKEGFIEGPNIVIPLKIQYNRWRVLGSFFLFLIGLILTSGIIPAGQLLNNLLKTAGPILSSLVVFYLYRRL
jgi:hypothetical protein